MYDYLWRWDTDWFWCSGAFGAQNPRVRQDVARRAGGARDAYHRLIGLEQPLRHRRPARPLRGRPAARAGRSRTSRCRWSGSGEFLRWFDDEVGMRRCGCARCACASRPRTRAWSLVPAGRSGHDVRQHRLLGHRATSAPRRRTADVNRAIETRGARAGRPQVALLRGVLRPRDASTGSTAAPTSRAVKQRYDPDHRLTEPLRQGGRRRR